MVTRVTAQAAGRKVAKNVQKNVKRAVSGTLGISGERMSKVDTAWLRMDNDANLMMIVGVWQLAPGVKHAAVCERIENSLLKYDRFKQRVMEDAAGATWVMDRNFDLANHVVPEKLPKSANQEQALQDRVAELATQRLDPKRPLWQIHLIEDYTGPDGVKGSAMIVRIHHCIADGIALISVTMSLVDGGAPPPVRRKKEPAAGAEDWIADTLLKPFTDITVKALGAVGEGAARSLGMLGDPKKGMEQGVSGSFDMAKVLFQLLSDSAALALMPDDSKTRLKGKPGGAKKVAWCQPIPLDEVKAVGKALNCSINDVLLSCVAGALGEYLKTFGDDVAGQEIRAMVPVNLRPMDQAHKLGNRFGLVPLVLPIGVDNPIERVYEVRRRMAALKGSYQPLLAFSLLAVAGLLIKPAQDVMLNLFAKKTTAVMTNVPGPREKLKFCGSTLEQSLFWVPQSGDVGLGVSILSYGGGVQFGVITDSTLCPEPQRIIDEFVPEFAKLSIVTLMLPWGE
ncbi:MULTISPECIES: wax ester/triacylglycerol synthase family O-acyltransferase [unclassified Polaromonas]|uniref:wax ester/triacylglycerol synthase family O-acyltransferase n=1 Tax=unclassified Polaromonas TaxID=2638319 RepID=UPI000F077C5E|nr:MULTISPECIES: wax ester/triacylglycerol synthase family O-acyltransferase [unclassified Polaromonas]AYQ27257.1 wax ester/triacylglycerol synthase family O-acyltransferase [Polaromonas sp. SP1]QGJ17901.1 wax ester/triacylglycerol synthase family O-acyltransferase [Polaromonas sp. Pch-P]